MNSEEKQEDGETKHRGWKAMPYVIGNETCEKLGTMGTATNLLVYLKTVFHMSSVKAATTVSIWNGTTNIATIAGAFLSDSLFGRYAVIGFSSIISFLGMTSLALTAAVPALHPGTLQEPTSAQLGFLVSALGLLVVGAGGIRPCNLAFGADQFDSGTDSGRKGISSFFNLYYVTFTASVMVAATAIVYVQSNVSWAVGLGIPAVLMLLSCTFFFAGSSIYIKVMPEGSPFTGIARVMAAAARKSRLKDNGAVFFDPPAVAGSLNVRLSRTTQFRFLDKAAIINPDDKINAECCTTENPWRLCTIQQVEETKCLLRILPIWWAATIFFLASAQQSTFSILQALQCDRQVRGTSFHVPAASFSVFPMIVVTLWIPLYDRVVVPCLRRRTKKEEAMTLLQRIGIGLVISIVSTVTASMVERRRKKDDSSISAFWLVPQLGISGLAEAFAIIGQVEFYYKQFPENMRSVAGSFLFLAMAVANYLGGCLITIVHRTTKWLTDDLDRGNLELYYLLVAGLEAINFIYFLVISRWYRYKDF